MNIEDLRSFCLSLKGAKEGLPFDNKTLVFSVKGKMFCATDVEDYELINVKCEPEEAILLREKYEDVIPGYYMNKKHWNTITLDSSIPDDLLTDLIEISYSLVVRGLTKAERLKISEG